MVPSLIKLFIPGSKIHTNLLLQGFLKKLNLGYNDKMKPIIKYFFQGLLYIVPIAILIYVISQIFFSIGALLEKTGLHVHPLIDPLLGIFSLIALIVAIGALGGTILFKPIFVLTEGLIEKAPLISTFYNTIKDLMTALLGSKKRFTQPVLVKLNKQSDIERLGFVTKDDLTEFGISKEKVAVYLPHSYNFSGNLYIVPRENITPVDASSSQILKMIVSGGITDVSKENEVN
jgi:uncharacterized membrane protein